jgi:hypothetical protein
MGFPNMWHLGFFGQTAISSHICFVVGTIKLVLHRASLFFDAGNTLQRSKWIRDRQSIRVRAGAERVEWIA